MKIIDLLVNLNNFNKCELDNMPGIIKYNNKIFYFNSKDVKGYYTEKPGKGGESLFKEINHLNDTIEILEEEKKIPEKINKSYDIRILDLDKPHSIKDYDMEQLIEMVQDIYEKQGEICDYLKIKGE